MGFNRPWSRSLLIAKKIQIVRHSLVEAEYAQIVQGLQDTGPKSLSIS